MGATAADVAVPAALSRVAIKRRHTEQGRRLAAPGGCPVRAASAHKQAAVTGPQPGTDWMISARRARASFVGDASQHALVAAGQVGLQGLAAGSRASSRLSAQFGAELAQGSEVFEQFTAQGQQVTELLEVALLRGCRWEAV